MKKITISVRVSAERVLHLKLQAKRQRRSLSDVAGAHIEEQADVLETYDRRFRDRAALN